MGLGFGGVWLQENPCWLAYKALGVGEVPMGFVPLERSYRVGCPALWPVQSSLKSFSIGASCFSEFLGDCRRVARLCAGCR